MEWTHLQGGTEWLVDALDCDPARLRDMEALVGLGSTLVRALELQVIGAPLLHQFEGPGGITALYLLTESHLAWHTYPEAGLCTLNVYCCRPRPMLDWNELLCRTLGARRVTLTMVRRGMGDAPGSGPAHPAVAEGELSPANEPPAGPDPASLGAGVGRRS